VVIVGVSFAEMGGYDCGGEVAEDPGGGCLNGVYVCRGEEEFAERFTTVFRVEEGEEGPVDKPGSVIELDRGIRERLPLDKCDKGGYTLSFMISLTLLSSSIAPSQFPERISAASFPHAAAAFIATSVDYY